MRISERSDNERPSTLRTRVIETMVIVTAFALVPEMVGAQTGAALEPHPCWIAVLVLSARYGSGGFLAGVGASVAAVGIGATLAGTGAAVAWSRILSPADLYALGASLVVSWVAGVHLRRLARMRERIQTLADRAADVEAASGALQDAVATLRARVDRTSGSLSFLRDAAERLGGRDPVAAAEGAADLALVRTGASAVAIQVGDGETQRPLAVRDARGPGNPAPSGERGVDIHVPIRSGSEQVGAITVTGIPPSELDLATAHDLSVIASWCGSAVAAARAPAVENAGGEVAAS